MSAIVLKAKAATGVADRARWTGPSQCAAKTVAEELRDLVFSKTRFAADQYIVPKAVT